jgi:predicted nucleic acid-binding protein
VIYLDSSALVKLAVVEAGTVALTRWLAEHEDQARATSELARVEVTRAVMRAMPTALLQAHHVVARTYKVALTEQVLDTAASLQPQSLRSLDAIHLASALTLGSRLTAFVCYDERLNAAASALSLPVTTP